MSKSGLLDSLLEQKKGIIRTADIISAGVSKPYFAEYVEKHGLERVSHGIYVTKDAWWDPMYLLQLRHAQAIFSHETALFLHDLTDREPIQYAVTIKTGYNTSKLLDANAKVFTIRKDLYELGASEATNNLVWSCNNLPNSSSYQGILDNWFLNQIIVINKLVKGNWLIMVDFNTCIESMVHRS